MVCTRVASIEDDVSVLRSTVSVNIEAVVTTVSQVSVGSTEPVDSLSGIIWNVLSDDNDLVESLELTSSVRDGVVLSPLRSDGS